MRHRLLASIPILLLACQRDDPVLPGIPDAPLLVRPAAEADAASPGEPTPPERTGPAPYVKPEGVHVDIRYLGNRSYTESRDTLTAQLGRMLRSASLAGDNGRELTYERGVIRVTDDRIYMIRVPLPTPLRRTDALVASGFPPQADRYIVLHREYRLNHEWGFRRLRMKRQDRYSELVTEIEAWRWVPGEHGNRR